MFLKRSLILACAWLLGMYFGPFVALGQFFEVVLPAIAVAGTLIVFWLCPVEKVDNPNHVNHRKLSPEYYRGYNEAQSMASLGMSEHQIKAQLIASTFYKKPFKDGVRAYLKAHYLPEFEFVK